MVTQDYKQRQNQFKKLRRETEIIQAYTYLPNYQPRKLSQSFVINLLSLSELSLQDTPFKSDNPTVVSSSRYYVSYSATLYN